MTLVFWLVLVLMPLKPLQIKQSYMINKKLLNSHAFILNDNNNKKNT